MTEQVLPNYLKESVDRIAFEHKFREYSIEVKKGSKAGDGFASDIANITIVNGKSDKKLDIVCKTAPLNPNRRKEFLSKEIFDIEATFYSEVMPTFAKYQEEKRIPKEDQFLAYPKCFGTILDDENERYVILLEDLRPMGFSLWDKQKPVTIEIARLAMRELGKFHGISVAMKNQKPTEFAKFQQMSDRLRDFIKKENFTAMFRASYERAIKAMRREDHKNIYRSINDNCIAFFDDCFSDEMAIRFGVMCHGDFWNNNVLYQFNVDGVAKDIRMLDWQLLRYASPATDLVYNLFSTTDRNMRVKEYDNLLRLYHQSLTKMVKLLGADTELFTFENLTDELERCGYFALLMAPMMIQTIQADSSDLSNLDEVCDNMARGEGAQELITGLSEEAQRLYEDRLNDIVEDVVNLGYYRSRVTD